MKETVEVEDQAHLDQEEARNSSGDVENIKQGQTKKVNKERIERLKKAFRPRRLQDIR